MLSSTAQNGWALTYVGRKDEAIDEASVEWPFAESERDGINGANVMLDLARIYTLVGEHEKAMDTAGIAPEAALLAGSQAGSRSTPTGIRCAGIRGSRSWSGERSGGQLHMLYSRTRYRDSRLTVGLYFGVSCAATICHFPFLWIHVSVQRAAPFEPSAISQVSVPRATAASP